jgi:hypothetical protein
LPTHLRIGLPSGLFPSHFPTNILYAFLFSAIRATYPAHLMTISLSIRDDVVSDVTVHCLYISGPCVLAWACADPSRSLSSLYL